MKKRLLAALMAGAMALTMTACGGSSSGSDDSNAPPAAIPVRLAATR